jgi:hypothetical protein
MPHSITSSAVPPPHSITSSASASSRQTRGLGLDAEGLDLEILAEPEAGQRPTRIIVS